MKVRLDADSLAAVKQLTEAMNDLISAFVSLHGSIEALNSSAIEMMESVK